MPNLSKIIRNSRFRLKSSAEVVLLIETKTGNKLKLKPENCSLTGMGCVIDGTHGKSEGLELHDLIPAAKLTWEDHEYSLGRLVLRTIKHKNNQTYIGLSTVDSKIPIDSQLSHFLEPHPDGEKTPYDFELSSEKFNLATFAEANQSNIDLLARCKQFSIFHKEWKKSPKYLYNTVRTPSMGPRVNLSRVRKGKRNDYIVMASNDYLGLASHQKVVEASESALKKFGFGSTGSPLTTGITSIHKDLENLITRIFNKEAAILFNSGYTANLGTIQGLTSANDLVIGDILSHASVQDGMQLTRATARFFKHNDAKHLEKLFEENRQNHAGALTVTEGVFSMDGDISNLDKIVEVSKKFNSRVMLDEAHSFGVIGPAGKGAAAKFNLSEEIDIIMGTFSKICGGIGGFVTSKQEVIDWLHFYARAHMFSVAVPPSTAAAALEALKIFESSPEIVENLQKNISHFRDGLKNLGFNISENHQSAVVPVIIGDEKKLGIMNHFLQQEGIYVIPIVYPAVSRNSCRFRFTLMATHTVSDLDFVLDIFAQAMKAADFSFDQSCENEPGTLTA